MAYPRIRFFALGIPDGYPLSLQQIVGLSETGLACYPFGGKLNNKSLRQRIAYASQKIIASRHLVLLILSERILQRQEIHRLAAVIHLQKRAVDNPKPLVAELLRPDYLGRLPQRGGIRQLIEDTGNNRFFVFK